MFETYKPSGRFGPLTIPLALVGIALAIALAFVYQLLLRWIPLIWINFLITLGLGIALGTVGASLVGISHCRNTLIGLLFGVALTLAAVGGKFYFQHMHARGQVENMMRQEMAGVDFAELIKEQGDDAPVKNPKELADRIVEQTLNEFTMGESIKARAAQGWELGRRGNGGLPIKGPFVYLIWLIELGAVAYFAVRMTRAAASEPYSEKLNAWASEAEHVMLLPITSVEMVNKIKSATNVEELLEIPIPQTDESMQFANYTVNSIEGQELEDAYLTVELLTFSINAKGEQEKKEESLVKYAVLSSEQRKQLVENASLLQEALADFRASVDEEEMGIHDQDELEEQA